MQVPEPSSGPRKQDILWEALKRKKPQERAAFLDGACGGDSALRVEIEALLAGEAEKQGTAPLSGDAAGVRGEGAATQTTPTLLDETPVTEGPGTVIGRYKLLEQIGEGGFGVVYVAEQQQPVRRQVALKIIKLGMDTRQVVARFEAERQALALMDHPNIAKVFDAGATDTGRPFFVMELVKGVPITQYCDQQKLSTSQRLGLFIKVCQAVQHAHQKGIIHRDIKPSNILVTLQEGTPVPKVIDFGIAKATQQRLTEMTLYTQVQQFIGTPAYMSPEQAEMSGLDIDTRSDIYSLGVLLYELLVGKTPFDSKELLAAGLDEIRRTIREKEPARPSTRLSTMAKEELTTTTQRRGVEAPKLISLLQGDLDWIVMKCLEKDRTRRYETANGLAKDIERHLTHEPVIARPASAAYRFRKAYRRNKLVFTAATAVATALVAGIGVSTWQTVQAKKAQRDAEVARNGEQRQRLEAQSAQKVAEIERQRADESKQHARRLLYASDMNLVQQALKLNNLGKARRLLDRHRPQSGEEDLRGWEWRYLWQLTRSSALVTLTNRPTSGFSISFSPDGTRLAVGWINGCVDLWDVPGRGLVRALTDREYPHPGRVAFSPVRNLLAATSEPKVVALYDLDSGRESTLWRAPDQGAWEVRDLGFSQDGSKVVIYAGPHAQAQELGDAVWVVNVSSCTIESRHPTVYSYSYHFGAARLSPDNQRLYLARSDALSYRYSIQCIDLTTGKELWQTERQRDYGLSTLDISPDGRVLASGSGFEDPTIHVWDAATGRLLVRLEGHTAWVCKLTFSKDGRRLISSATDQSIRFWDTSTWDEARVLRGHSDEVAAVAISEPAQLIASASKDGDLMLWKEDGNRAADAYTRLPENLRVKEVLPLDHSRVLLLDPGKPPELVDLKGRSSPGSLPGISSSTDVLGCFGSNILCHWNGTNQILVRELHGAEFIQRGAITLESGTRPAGLAYNATRQLLAWTEGTASASVYLASLTAPARRIELRSDVPGLVPFEFSEDGKYLSAATVQWDSLRAWNLETGQLVASIDGRVRNSAFAAGGWVFVVAIDQGTDHEIRFYDLAHPDRSPRRVRGRNSSWFLAVSPEGGLVAASTRGGEVRLFDPAKGELIESIHGHLNAAFAMAFSADGRRLISADGGREAVKLWDVGTRQELLTLSGTGSILRVARWSADGDVILAGPPWQAWRAPSWEEIAAAEKSTDGKTQ